MLNVLIETVGKLEELIKDQSRWQSLVVNKRKPHTYRAFTYDGDNRICLHRFEPCSKNEVFAHPHPWPGAFLVLHGRYRHKVGYSPDLESSPTWHLDSILTPGSMYEIVDPQTWHFVQPLETCYSIMVNGPEWADGEKHAKCVTTKGKDLKEMDEEELRNHLFWFHYLLPKIKLYGEKL